MHAQRPLCVRVGRSPAERAGHLRDRAGHGGCQSAGTPAAAAIASGCHLLQRPRAERPQRPILGHLWWQRAHPHLLRHGSRRRRLDAPFDTDQPDRQLPGQRDTLSADAQRRRAIARAALRARLERLGRGATPAGWRRVHDCQWRHRRSRAHGARRVVRRRRLVRLWGL